MNNNIYVISASQISVQKPLCEAWMDNPIFYETRYERALNPNFKEYFSPIEARRMGHLLKRAVATSLKVMRDSGIANPDAIITGTGLGCIENTELFLDALCKEGESMLKPTYFMQSTHNTISSLLAIKTKSHGYNITYAHKGISFDSALLDAYLQMKCSRISTALVGSHDEVTPSYFKLLERIGYVGGSMEGFCGEASVAVMLSGKEENAICRLAGMSLLYKPSIEGLKAELCRILDENQLAMEDIDAVLTGINGNSANDSVYSEYLPELFKDIPQLKYKNIFGECYSSSALAFYAVAQCLKFGKIPQCMICGNGEEKIEKVRNILIFNQQDGKNFSMTLLRK